jgi:hypothetical protein
MLASVAKRPPALEALGAHLGLRTLYELLGAWKQDAQGVERWIEARDPAAITQADARSLAAGVGRTKAGRADAPPEPPSDRGEARERGAASRAIQTVSPRLLVKQGRRVGVLMLDRSSDPEGRVTSAFRTPTNPRRCCWES